MAGRGEEALPLNLQQRERVDPHSGRKDVLPALVRRCTHTNTGRMSNIYRTHMQHTPTLYAKFMCISIFTYIIYAITDTRYDLSALCCWMLSSSSAQSIPGAVLVQRCPVPVLRSSTPFRDC